MDAKNSVGSMKCRCGETMDVRQSVKRGHYLYTVCPCCGLDQRTGEPVQNEIWHNATFSKEAKRPANIRDDWKANIAEKPSEPSTEKPSEPLSEKSSEVRSTSLDLSEEEIMPEAAENVALERTPKRKVGAWRVVGVLMMLASFVGVAWTQI